MCEKSVDMLNGRPAELTLAMGICPKPVERQIGRAKNSKIQTVCVKKALIGRPAELALAMGICPKPVERQIGRAKNSKIQTVCVKKALIC